MASINVAGVTFTNEDGESRQQILRDLGFGFHYALLKQTTYENERAVEVWIDSKMVGYVPRKNLDDAMSYAEILRAQILYMEQEDILYVELTSLEQPMFAS